MVDETDWLNDSGVAAREENHQKAKEFAELYLVFVDTDRGRRLLEHLDNVHLYRRTPINANIQQYAADEAIRAFVAGIHRQIELAQERD